MKIKRQNDIKDCGPIVIQAIHKKYYDEWINLNQMKLKVDYGSKGINVKNFISLASHYGIESEGYKVDVDSIIKAMPNKYIVGLIDSDGMNHYVLFKYHKEKIHIVDSIKGNYSMSVFEFKKIFTEMIITFERGKYTPEEIDITHPMKYLSKNWNLIAWISCSLVLSIIFVFVSSLFMKIILDKIIPGKLNSSLAIISLSFAFLAILRAMNKIFRLFLVKKLSLQIERDLTFTYFEKIRDSGYKDISKITINDNLRRIGLIAHVSGFISNSFFVVFNELAMFIVATSLLIWISPTLFAVSLGAAGLVSIITVGFRSLNRSKYDDLIKNKMSMFNSFIDTINQTKELKQPRVAKLNQSIFNREYTKSKTKEYEVWGFNTIQGLLEQIIELSVPILLVFLGTKDVFQDKLTVGSLLMFISIFNSFISPVKDLCDFFLQLPQMQRNIDLISFIINSPDEPINPNGLKMERLKSIKIKDLKVGYDRTLIHISDWTIDKSIKLKGKNGTGKSTLLNSIGTVLESKGQIYFNNFEKDYYSLYSLREKIAIISPSTYIPNMTILEYATLNNKQAMETLLENAAKYNLISLMKSLGLSFETPLINNGQNISSGQRQVVTLLRLFSFKYELIILDEAFENIDTHKLKGIKKAITDFQDSLYIEVSHSGKYISNGKVVNIEEINSNPN